MHSQSIVLFTYVCIHLFVTAFAVSDDEDNVEVGLDVSVIGLEKWAIDTYKLWFNGSILPYVLMAYVNNNHQRLNCGNFTGGIMVKKDTVNVTYIYQTQNTFKVLINTGHIYNRLINGTNYYEIKNINQNSFNDLSKAKRKLYAALYSKNCVLTRAVDAGKATGSFKPHYEEVLAYYLFKVFANLPPQARDVPMLAFSGKKPCDYGDQDCLTNHRCSEILNDIGHRKNSHNVNWANIFFPTIDQRLLYFSRLEKKTGQAMYGYINWNAPQNNNQCQFRVLATEAERQLPVTHYFNALNNN